MSEIELVRFVPCPKCRHENREEELQCAKCKVVFADYDPNAEPEYSPPVHPVNEPQIPHPELGAQPQVIPGRPLTTSKPPFVKIGVLLVGLCALAYFLLLPPYQMVGAEPAAGHRALVLMHGYGAPKDDLIPLAEKIVAGAPNVSIVVLEAPHSKVIGRAWFTGGSLEKSLAQVVESHERVLDAVEDLEDAGVATSDIYLGGFSQGAQMAVDVGAGRAVDKQFGGLILMSGGWPSWPHAVTEKRVKSDNFATPFRVLVTHGKSDRVISHGSGRSVANALDPIATVEFLEFDGAHQIPESVVTAIAEFLGS